MGLPVPGWYRPYRACREPVSREWVIRAGPGEIRAVLVEAGQPVELRIERDQDGSLLGALFLGRVLRVLPALPGAFIEIGRDRPAFLPGNPRPGAAKLVEGAGILVQVAKDAVADKAPEVTAEPSFHGKLAVWTPARPGIAVSRQIAPAERARLSQLLEPLVEPGEGIVLRSHAIGADAEALAEDIARLRRDYAQLLAAIAGIRPPARLDPGPGPLDRVLQSVDSSISRILVEDRDSFAQARRSLSRRDPALVPLVVLDPSGGYTEQKFDAVFEAALDRRVDLPGGASLVIETVTACTFIDVNLGAMAGGRQKAGAAIRQVNLQAAAEIARQLRLRNLAGAILIDFVSMSSREHRHDVELAFEQAAAVDPVAIEFHGWTRLGHFELTRRRGTAPLADIMLEAAGPRRAKTPVTIALEIMQAILVQPLRPGPMIVTLHPLVAAELDGNLAASLAALVRLAGRPIRLKRDPALALESFSLSDA